MLIKLNTSNGEVWINPSVVMAVYGRDNDEATVIMDDDLYYRTTESVNEVVEKINNWK